MKKMHAFCKCLRNDNRRTYLHSQLLHTCLLQATSRILGRFFHSHSITNNQINISKIDIRIHGLLGTALFRYWSNDIFFLQLLPQKDIWWGRLFFLLAASLRLSLPHSNISINCPSFHISFWNTKIFASKRQIRRSKTTDPRTIQTWVCRASNNVKKERYRKYSKKSNKKIIVSTQR